ncbi:hypothetical protein LTS10_004697 [Elasticomyces elasticus]|nr:hypothetical protein LTS10_004697 [Elasticomyces elasticus]
MAPPNPTILIIHGGWHTPAHFDALSKELRQEGYEVVAPHLPSCNNEADPGDAISKDADVVAASIDSITKSGKDLVMVMHSYGGTAGSDGLGVYLQNAPTGSKGKVLQLVFLSALLLNKGETPASQQIVDPGEDAGPAPQISPEGLILVAPAGDKAVAEITRSRLYNETPAEIAEEAMDGLTGFALSAYISETKYQGWSEVGVPATYVLCGKDQAWPPAQQKRCIERLGKAGVKVDVVEKAGWDHSAYLSHAREVAEIVVKAAQ